MRRLYDRDLLDALEALHSESFSGTAWRTTWATRDPLIGSTAGGRWHPENSFEALYTSTETDGSLAEVYFHLARAPVFSSAHVRLYQLRIETRRTLRLDLEILDILGVEAARYSAMDYARTARSAPPRTFWSSTACSHQVPAGPASTWCYSWTGSTLTAWRSRKFERSTGRPGGSSTRALE